MDPLQLILFILPAYVANSAPVISGGRTPVDLGASLPDKRRLLGPGKTYRGLLFGMAGALLTGLLLAQFPQYYLVGFSFEQKMLVAALMGAGTLIGDAVGSFIKRRQGLERGRETAIMDKLLFLVFALALAWPVYSTQIALNITDLAILLVLTFILHIAFNRIAHWLKLKSVPW